MIDYNFVFDDIVADKYGTWTQVCELCSEKHDEFGFLSKIAIDGLICGVEGCQNEAHYYFDFDNEE